MMGESHAVLIEENARLKAKLEEAEKARGKGEQVSAALLLDAQAERDELKAKLAAAGKKPAEVTDYAAGVEMVKRRKAEAERDELKGKLADWQETHNNIIAERCAPDEVHCTCVPSLRKRIQELEAKLAEAETRWHNRPVTCDREACSCIARLEIENKKLEAACAAYRRALEIEACETRMRIGRVGEDCDDHLCPLESGDCYGRWAADALKANPAGAAMLEVWKAAEEFRDWADGVTSAKNKQTWTQAVMAFFKGDVPNTFHELNRHLRSICEKVRALKGGE